MLLFRVLYFIEFCAYFRGLLVFTNVVSKDCSENLAEEHLLLNKGDNITFFVEKDGRDGLFDVYHDWNLICRVKPSFSDLFHLECLTMYQNRTSATLVNAEPDHIEFSITISTAESSDNGSYEVSDTFSSYLKCFSVYILGPPTSEITVTPAEIDVGNVAIVTCSAKSTTIPATHNLPIHILWYIGGQIIKTGGRFRVNTNELIIPVVTKADINLVVTCEAKEEGGLTTRTNRTLPVYWGPDPGPELQPPNTFYHFEPSARLPDIHCSADCHPTCDLRWYKHGSPAVLSFNGTLSLGKLDRNSTGEYTCTATYSRAIKKSSISVFILMKEVYVPRPKLQPSNAFYHTQPDTELPNIHCSVDCHPACDLRWYKLGNPDVLSFNETLSLGVLDRNSSGEYTCIAINSETTEKSSISFYVIIQEDQVPRPKLQPSNTFYHTQPDIELPNIYCSVDCRSACDLRWYKLGNPAVLSSNGTLSLGVLDRNSSGEYTCMAINSETTEKGSISFYVLIQENQEHTHTNTDSESSEFNQNYTPLGAVGGALGAALLLALICNICLLIRGNTSKLCNPVSSSSHKNDPLEMSLQNPRYEDVPVTERTSQHYEAINTDLARAVIKESGTSEAPKF